MPRVAGLRRWRECLRGGIGSRQAVGCWQNQLLLYSTWGDDTVSGVKLKSYGRNFGRNLTCCTPWPSPRAPTALKVSAIVECESTVPMSARCLLFLGIM